MLLVTQGQISEALSCTKVLLCFPAAVVVHLLSLDGYSTTPSPTSVYSPHSANISVLSPLMLVPVCVISRTLHYSPVHRGNSSLSL